MGDQRLRELERARGGDPDATRRLAVERSRSGVATVVDRAYACWVAGDRDAALGLLLERWRELPAPALADAIGQLTAHVARPRGAIPGRNRAELMKTWREVEGSGDRFDAPRLLEALRRLRCGEANDLLAATERWPRDPRVSAALVDYFEQPPGDWRGRANSGFWIRALRLLRAGADPRTRARLQKVLADRGERYLAALGDLLAERLPGLIGDLPEVPGALEPAEQTSLASLVASIEGPDLAGAWADVRARPDDDAARLALAEGLERTGDTRGEFIRLQVERGRSGNPTARERTLLHDWYDCPWSLLFWRGPTGRLSRVRIIEERSVPHQPPLGLLERALARRPRALEGLDRIELLLRASTARRTRPETLEPLEAALAGPRRVTGSSRVISLSLQA